MTRTRATSREEVLIQNPRLPARPVDRPERVAALTPVQREEAITAFERLSEDERLLIAARYHLGMSSADAATVSGIPEALTGLRLRQAVRRLRSRLSDSV
jgi:DNA-directed RNA polymerase specialized sigma24 family protein